MARKTFVVQFFFLTWRPLFFVTDSFGSQFFFHDPLLFEQAVGWGAPVLALVFGERSTRIFASSSSSSSSFSFSWYNMTISADLKRFAELLVKYGVRYHWSFIVKHLPLTPNRCTIFSFLQGTIDQMELSQALREMGEFLFARLSQHGGDWHLCQKAVARAAAKKL